ncbi:MAG TPA: protein kinase [Acidimicrobiales bacterium]|nr:protein kinase [Acidimicrobiales bacterium]
MTERAPVVLGGRYRLDAVLARGGMAEVWEAHDSLLDRPVAVKVPLAHLRMQPDFMMRFRREAVAAARLNHPNVVSVYDTGSDPDLGAYIVMELVPGPSLRDVIKSEGPFPVERAVAVAGQVAAALEFAHRRGVVHRDVKPANVLLAPDGVKVADFGIAKAALDADDLTQTNLMLGTARYLAPEQVEGRPLDARSDVYALGVVLYEMLCGRAPFDADSDLALAVKHLTAEAGPPSETNPEVPPWLDAVVMSTLAKDPDQRFQSAAALHRALVGAGSFEPPPPRPDPTRVGVAAVPAGAASAAAADPPEVGVSTLIADRPAPPDPAPPGPRRRDRPPALVIGAGFLAVALAIAALVALVGRGSDTGGGPGTTGTGGGAPPAGRPLPLAGAHSFNPLGSGTEHEEVVANLVDGNPQTYWYTEHYASPTFGNLKSGVGAYVQLHSPTPVARMVVESPDTGWRYQVYESSGPAPPGSLAGWGGPVADGTVGGPTTTISLPGRSAAYVLLWLTYLGDGAASVRVGEISLYP